MKTRWKILSGIVIILPVLISVWLMTLHVHPESAVEAYKKSLREHGEKLEISEVLPQPVPDGSNGASFAESAFALLSASYLDDLTNLPPAMRMIAPGKAAIGWQQPDLREAGSDGYTNSWDNAQAYVDAGQPAVELLQQAAGYPALDFHLDYQKEFDVLLKHLAPLKRSTQLLSATAMCDLHNGDTAAATTNLCILLALVRNDQDERFEISQLVRIAMASIAASATWECLQASNLSGGDLTKLQTDWSELEFIKPMENSMQMERAFQESYLKKARVSNAEVARLFGFSMSSGAAGSGDWLDDVKERLSDTRDQAGVALWRASWSYSDEMFLLKNEQIVLEALRAIEANCIFKTPCDNIASQTKSLETVFSGKANPILGFIGMDRFQWMFSEITMSSGATLVRKVMAAETCKHIVITAIALKRFQLQHGNLPEKLSELTPEFLPATPLDPVDGQPLRYRRNADGTYLLYSVGEDGMDNGGDPTLPAGITGTSLYWQNPHARDWVWPQPATAAEVQFYYDHPPK